MTLPLPVGSLLLLPGLVLQMQLLIAVNTVVTPSYGCSLCCFVTAGSPKGAEKFVPWCTLAGERVGGWFPSGTLSRSWGGTTGPVRQLKEGLREALLWTSQRPISLSLTQFSGLQTSAWMQACLRPCLHLSEVVILLSAILSHKRKQERKNVSQRLSSPTSCKYSARAGGGTCHFIHGPRLVEVPPSSIGTCLTY